MADSALETWLFDYRAGHPQLEPAWIFLRGDPRRDVYGAFEALKQEWLNAAYAIRAPQVAATKLQWWAEELQCAHGGHARHPLTLALFADAGAREIPLAWWHEALQGALLQLEAAPVSDLPAQLAQAAPLHEAIARMETVLWFGPKADARRTLALAAAQRAIAALRNLPMEVECGRAPLPMALLARHALTQTALVEDSPPRRAALRDQARALERVLDETGKLPGPLGLFRGLQARLDRRALRRALRAEDPLGAMQSIPRGFGTLLDAWREARAWHAARPT